MKVGILSDTHGHLARTRQAATVLRRESPDCIVHCGDIGGEAVLIELGVTFVTINVPVHAVLGNVDLGNRDLYPVCAADGVTVHGDSATLELGGTHVAVYHGHGSRVLDRLLVDGRYDYVLTGHTHRNEVQRYERATLINPGAVYRAVNPTVALLDTATDEVRFLPL